jgi:glycosyltransferase involved in cell wall biosynthesis
MKACMVAYAFYEGDNRIRRYAESLVQRGDEVEAIALRRPGQAAFEVIRGVKVYRIQQRSINETGPFSYLIKLLLFLFRTTALLAWRQIKQPYGLIHVHSVPDFQVFSALVPRLLGAKVILDIHDIVPEFYASKFDVTERSPAFRTLLLAEKLSIAFADHVIIANHIWEAKLHRRAVKPGKCLAMINFPDTTIFHRRTVAEQFPGRFVLCYPGSLNWHQGLDLAIEAMHKIRAQAPQALLVIIGDGPERETLRALIREKGLQESVQMRERLPLEKIAEMMASVHLGVVPKRNEGFGDEAFSTKIMEFMAMGVPVLAAETTIDRYYFNEKVLQFFKPGDASDLAEKILHLIGDVERRESLRAQAGEFIALNTWDVKKKEYLDLVERLTGEARGRESYGTTIA